MCVQGRQQTRPQQPLPRPPPLPRGGCLGGGKRNKKVNTIVLELVCLVTEQWQQQIFSTRAGQPGGCSKKRNSLYQYVHLCHGTLLKEVCTGMYVRYVPVCISVYRDIPLCNVMCHDIPRYTCTGTYQYIRVQEFVVQDCT